MSTPPPADPAAPTSADDHDDFGGLCRDLPALVDRRSALRFMGGLGLAGVATACSSDGGDGTAPTTVGSSATGGSSAATSSASTATPTSSTSPSSSTSAPSSTSNDAARVEPTPGAEIPEETAGPFPADGTNGPNVLEIDGVVRPDLTTSIGELSGTAAGVPTALQLTVVDAATGDPRPGAAVYAWHCTADGRYSVYQVEDQNYLRGVQTADDGGRVVFDSVFPGCYRGRWPHVHIEIYPDLDQAASGATPITISQIALPKIDCEAVYADPAYGDSAENLAQLSLATDGVFSDGWEGQLATVAGSVDQGYTASLLIRV